VGGDWIQMARFFVNKENISENEIVITGDDVNHIKNVLRLKVDTEIGVSDGCGRDYKAEIRKIEKDIVIARITSWIDSCNEPRIKVLLVQAIPKSDKMDIIIQKNVELGIHSILPIVTARTVVKIDSADSGRKKTERWRRIALEAAKQSQRGIVPVVEEPVSFEKAVRTVKQRCDVCIIPCLREKKRALKEVLRNTVFNSIAVFIGPEGGFADEEVDQASAEGIIPVTLGARVLRTETAGLAVLSSIMYELGELG
jgi:16S rRNA (uracil1498-N3)-methyltransferase